MNVKCALCDVLYAPCFVQCALCNVLCATLHLTVPGLRVRFPSQTQLNPAFAIFVYSYLRKDRDDHAQECESCVCRYRLVGPEDEHFGCEWEGNKSDRHTHICALPSRAAFNCLLKAVDRIYEERSKKLKIELGQLDLSL